MTRMRWPNAFSILVLLVLVCIYLTPPSDLDFCWQIRTGERILDTGDIRQPDVFSYTIAGKDVPDHEWLYEVGLALVWRALGHPGLKLARVVLFFAPVAVLAWQLRRRGVARYAVSMLCLLCVIVLFFFERLRPMVCSTIGLQLVAGWLSDHVRGRRPLDWKLPLTMVLWGNLHPAVIMGQALILGAVAWEWLQAACGLARSPIRFTVWCLLAEAAALVAPAPIDRLLYPFRPELRHPVQRLFDEVQPPWTHLLDPPFTLWLVLLLAVIFSVTIALRWRHFRGWEWALLLGVAGLALKATRAVGDWLLITAALAVPQIGPLLKAAPRRLLKLNRAIKRLFDAPLFRPQPGWIAAGFGLFAGLSVLPWGDRLPYRENPKWPKPAVDWLEANGLPSPGPWKVFSGANEGSYLIWRLHDRVRVHADTRGFYYPGDMLEDSILLPAADRWRERLPRVLDRGTEYFFLPRQGAFWQLLAPQIPTPLYQDDETVIVTRQQVIDAVGKM